MKNIFTKILCLLLCFGSRFLHAQTGHAENIVLKESEGSLITETNNTETGSIKGHLQTTDYKNAAEINVILKEVNLSAITDENGDFIFKNVKAGSYTLSVSMVGLQTLEKQIQVTAFQTLNLYYTLSETAKQLEEVIVSSVRNSNLLPVSADKAGIAPIDLPQSMGVVSSKVIADQQANRLGDIVKNVSGVSLTQQRQGVAETFSARGYSIGVGGAGGSIFKNGIITNTMGFPEASALESVEVLKGSSALLYGNTSGGVIINMVTKKPKFEKGGEVSMRFASYNFYKPIADMYGTISKKLAYRIIGTYEKLDSYRNLVKTKRTYINPSLLYKPAKNTTILLQGDYLNSNITPDNGIGILNQNMDAVIPASRSRFINFSWAYYHLNQITGSLTIDHKFSDSWKMNFIAAAQGTKVNAFGSAVPNAIAANGDFVRVLNRTKTTEKDYTLQLNFTGNFNTAFIKHQLSAGSDAERIITGSNAFQYFNGGVSVNSIYDTINILNSSKFIPRPDIPQATDTASTTSPSNRIGFYIQDLISLTDKIKVLAGMRWSYLKTYQTNIFNYLTTTERKGVAAAVESKAFSPKLAFIYQPKKTTSLYIAYTNNFAANTGVDIYGSQLKPSLTDQYEAGLKNELFKGKLAANLSVYRIINHNFAQMAQSKTDGSVNSDPAVKELSGETTSDGFEVDVNGTISRNLYFITGYGNNYMRYTKTSGLKGSNVEGERLINNPANTFNATVFYTFNQTAFKGLKLGASAFYTGKRNGGIQNTINQTPEYNRLVALSDFTTIDLSAGYTFKHISLQAKLSNITNTLNYLGHDRYSINPIPPRQFAATVSYKF